jgi:hypothetical protein
MPMTDKFDTLITVPSEHPSEQRSFNKEPEYHHAREVFFMSYGIFLGGLIALSTWWIATAVGVGGVSYAAWLLWKSFDEPQP